MNKRADNPLAITLLVVMVMLLCGISLFFFYSSQKQVQGDLGMIQVISSLNSDKLALDFYVEQIAREVMKENPAISEEQFKQSFIVKAEEFFSQTGTTELKPFAYSQNILNQLKEINKYEVKISGKVVEVPLNTLGSAYLQDNYVSFIGKVEVKIKDIKFSRILIDSGSIESTKDVYAAIDL